MAVETGRRRCPARNHWHLDVATALCFYLMFVDLAGSHAYGVIGRNPEYRPPDLPGMVQEARAQVQRYQSQLPSRAQPPSLAEMQAHLDGRAQGLLQRLDRLDQERRAPDHDRSKWDEAIYVAEELRRIGDKLVEEGRTDQKDRTRAKLRVGLTVALRGAQTHAHIAELISEMRGRGPRVYKTPGRGPAES